MEHEYWLGRERSALTMARDASSAETRLIHFELAGNYSLKAMSSDPLVWPVKALPAPVHAAWQAPEEAAVTSFLAAGAGRDRRLS